MFVCGVYPFECTNTGGTVAAKIVGSKGKRGVKFVLATVLSGMAGVIVQLLIQSEFRRRCGDARA
jgi:hypothetical protein